MVVVEHHHRQMKYRSVAAKLRFLASIARIGKTGEYLREFPNIRVVIGGKGLTLRIQLPGTVGVQLIQPDGEELHDLTCIVLVGKGIRVLVGLRVVDVT